MQDFFVPNLTPLGRWLRFLLGAILIALAIASKDHNTTLAILLASFGIFGLFQAQRGWCLLLACKNTLPRLRKK